MDLFSQIVTTEREEILALRKELEEANHQYYVLNSPTMSDYDFDIKLRRLQDLEAQYPDMLDPNSPTQHVGSDLVSIANTQSPIANSPSPIANSQSPIICTDFVSQMPLAYALADLVISRAGASSISELCLLGKPSILVPSPNVAEDHQTHNAMALVKKQAAVLVKDNNAHSELIATALQLIADDQQLQELHTHILTLALPDSARMIAAEVMQLAQKK